VNRELAEYLARAYGEVIRLPARKGISLKRPAYQIAVDCDRARRNVLAWT